MSRSVWKGPFVDPSLLKKVEKLKPTNSGIIVDFLDQVLMGATLDCPFNFSTFLSKLGSTNGPFHTDLDINYFLFFFLEIINLFVLLFFLVFKPFADCPHGETGLLPPDVLPSPPPCG